MINGKTIALIRQIFVSKMISLLFNMLSRFVIAFREQASFNFMASVTVDSNFGTQENKVYHCSHFFLHRDVKNVLESRVTCRVWTSSSENMVMPFIAVLIWMLIVRVCT